MELSGKVGGKTGVSASSCCNFLVYGELSFVTTEDDPSVGTKLGAKLEFLSYNSEVFSHGTAGASVFGQSTGAFCLSKSHAKAL